MSSDEYLFPAVENDPLLREFICSEFPKTKCKDLKQLSEASLADDWSDDDEDDVDVRDPSKQIRVLEKKLTLAQRSLLEYRQLVQQKLDLKSNEESPSNTVKTTCDDDTHYFNSYAENGVWDIAP